MKKLVILSGLLSVAVLMSGCATGMFERQTALKVDPFSRSFDYSSADFQVLGPVEATGSSRVIMGIVMSGHEGYGLLMKAARQKYGPDVSTVMFIFSDYQYMGVLYPLVGNIATTYSGTAVKVQAVSHTANVRVKQ
jgi:hypothetical protein